MTIRLAITAALILTCGCAAQATGFVTHRERVRSGVVVQARMRAPRNPGPFMGVEVATGLGGDPNGVRLKSGGVMAGYDARRNTLGIPWLGAEIALVTAYGGPLGEPELEHAAYFLGTNGALTFRLTKLEEAEPSFAVLLLGFDIVLEGQAGVWLPSRLEPDHSPIFGWRLGLGLRFAVETDLILNRR